MAHLEHRYAELKNEHLILGRNIAALRKKLDVNTEQRYSRQVKQQEDLIKKLKWDAKEFYESQRAHTKQLQGGDQLVHQLYRVQNDCTEEFRVQQQQLEKVQKAEEANQATIERQNKQLEKLKSEDPYADLTLAEVKNMKAMMEKIAELDKAIEGLQYKQAVLSKQNSQLKRQAMVRAENAGRDYNADADNADKADQIKARTIQSSKKLAELEASLSELTANRKKRERERNRVNKSLILAREPLTDAWGADRSVNLGQSGKGATPKARPKQNFGPPSPSLDTSARLEASHPFQIDSSAPKLSFRQQPASPKKHGSPRAPPTKPPSPAAKRAPTQLSPSPRAKAKQASGPPAGRKRDPSPASSDHPIDEEEVASASCSDSEEEREADRRRQEKEKEKERERAREREKEREREREREREKEEEAKREEQRLKEKEEREAKEREEREEAERKERAEQEEKERQAKIKSKLPSWLESADEGSTPAPEKAKPEPEPEPAKQNSTPSWLEPDPEPEPKKKPAEKPLEGSTANPSLWLNSGADSNPTAAAAPAPEPKPAAADSTPSWLSADPVPPPQPSKTGPGFGFGGGGARARLKLF